MIQSALGVIAGVDRKTLSTCPASDKLWAAHLGASLCLSFIVVLGVSYHATGYMIESVSTRLLVSGVIALTVLMFDRALCQSDWFYQGTLWDTAPIQSSAEAKQTAWRFVRVGIRLLMSFGLAWVIAMFLELAIFSGTINEKIEADRVAANQPIYNKIAQYESGLNAEVARRQASIDALEALHRDALTEAPAPEPNLQTRNDDIEQQIKALVVRESEIRGDIGQIDRTIQRYIADMNAEEFGMKASPNNSGRPGAGPRYEFAKKQKEAFLVQRAAREAEIAQLHVKRDELRAAQSKIGAEALVARDQERAAIKAKADALQTRINAARAELKSFETAKVASVAEFRSKALAESYYQDKRELVDPLTRIAAYQELKNDPKDGGTMTLFSWMTRFFIIFLEIVPVVAKIFFSPPSVYAAKIQAQVERARQRIENNEDLDDDKPAEPAPVLAMAAMPLPAMSLDPVVVKPAPQPKAEPPKQPARQPERQYYEEDQHELPRRPARDRDDRLPDYRPREYAERDADPRGYGRRHDDPRRYGARDDYAGYDDFDRRSFERRDLHPRYDDERDYDRPRTAPVRRRTPQFAAQDYAAHDYAARNFGASSYGEPEFDTSEIDVRNLIVPRRGAPRYDTADQQPGSRIRFTVKDDAPATPDHAARPAANAERNLRWPDGLPVDDLNTRELLRQVLADAETGPRAEPERKQMAAVADTPPPVSEDAPIPADATAQPVVADAPAQPVVEAEAAAEPDVIPTFLGKKNHGSSGENSPAEAAPPAPHAAEEVAAPPGEVVGPVQKYSADVEKLMTEAMELSRARKKAAHPRRDHQHEGDAELPLDNKVQYEIFPKQ